MQVTSILHQAFGWGSCQVTDNLPARLPTSPPALTSNLESGNFKHKQTSLPQTASGAVPKEARAERS